MKKLIIYGCILLLPFVSLAQNPTDTIPQYKKDHFIPKFTLLMPDSTNFTNEDIPKKRPAVIIYFQPDCSHCQHEASEIAKHKDSLQNAFFVWASFSEPFKIKDFAVKYGLDKFENMRFGRDTKYFLPTYYKVTMTPFMGVYDKRGVFKADFKSGATPAQLIEAIK